MARKKTDDENDLTGNRQLAFRAPDSVHGALKMIVGRLEMGSFRFNGKQPSGQDVLIWLLCEMYMDGPDKWPGRIENAYARFVEFESEFGSESK